MYQDVVEDEEGLAQAAADMAIAQEAVDEADDGDEGPSGVAGLSDETRAVPSGRRHKMDDSRDAPPLRLSPAPEMDLMLVAARPVAASPTLVSSRQV